MREQQCRPAIRIALGRLEEMQMTFSRASFALGAICATGIVTAVAMFAMRAPMLRDAESLKEQIAAFATQNDDLLRVQAATSNERNSLTAQVNRITGEWDSLQRRLDQAANEPALSRATVLDIVVREAASNTKNFAPGERWIGCNYAKYLPGNHMWDVGCHFTASKERAEAWARSEDDDAATRFGVRFTSFLLNDQTGRLVQ